MLALLLAVASAASIAMIGFTSFTAFNPPDWLRIATMAPLPVLVILAVGFGIAGVKSKPGRTWAVTGLILIALAVLAFIVMISVGG